MYISSCLFSLISSGLLVTPRCFGPCLLCLVLSCPALMSPLKTVYLSLSPCLRVPVPPCCVHRDRRPDLNSKRRPFTSFCFPFFKSVLFVPVCLSLAARKSPLVIPALARVCGVGVWRDRCECRESAGREPSSPPIAGDIRCRLGLSQARRLVV